MSKDLDIKVTIIVPCYNAEGKIHKCIQSLKELKFPEVNYEVIFVDDFSSDRTGEIIDSEIKNHSNWLLHRLSSNSGSPSRPRNTGISLAKGEYIFFLDSDDEIIHDSIQVQYDFARHYDSCIVRGSLIVNNNGNQIIANQIKGFDNNTRKSRKIKKIITQQSTTAPSLIRRSLLIDHTITWREDIRLGEDTLFLIDVLHHSNTISYIDKPLFIYNKTVQGEASSTQIYGARELKNHLFVWNQAEKELKKQGFSYFKVRGKIALQTTLQALIKFYPGDIDHALFEEFSTFIKSHSKTVNAFKFQLRLDKALHYLLDNDYANFFQTLKPRLLIAGGDLKFINGVIPNLKQYYNLKVDQWTGHNNHNEKQSKGLLEWADIIFCEWLLGNAVWYSTHKKQHQKLIIRMHRFELTRDFGHQVNDENVDWYCTVGVYILEKMLETFHYERGKVRLIPNFIDTEKYQTSNDQSKVFNLGIVGILPSRKGYLTALKLLNELQTKDKRYNLSVFGKMPEELSWVIKDKKEREYFGKCNDYIKTHQLEDKVKIKGWVDTQKELKDIGFILSVSSNIELVESFHIAPAEAFTSGNQGIFLHWDGVEYLYPKDYIFNDLSEMTEYIVTNSNFELFNNNAQTGRSFVKENYNTQNFIRSFNTMVKEDF